MKKILLLTFEYPVGKRYCGEVGQVVKQCRDILLAVYLQTFLDTSALFKFAL